jgi:hypothetical protein
VAESGDIWFEERTRASDGAVASVSRYCVTPAATSRA